MGGSSQADVPPTSEIVPPSEASDSAPTMVIWGTDVSVNLVKAKFAKFISTFIAADLAKAALARLGEACAKGRVQASGPLVGARPRALRLPVILDHCQCKAQ